MKESEDLQRYLKEYSSLDRLLPS